MQEATQTVVTDKTESRKLVDLTGMRFHMLTVIENAGRKISFPSGKVSIQWMCKCDCGKFTKKTKHQLLKGRNYMSCGCFARKWHGMKVSTHRMTKSIIYGRYRQMLNRCYSPKVRGYAEYGARGITVCERWRNSFENFYADMGDPPPGCSLERKNNNGNYEPGNVIWADAKTQQRNTRQNRLYTHQGKTRCIAEWCEVLGVSHTLVRGRLYKGWDFALAVTIPSRKYER